MCLQGMSGHFGKKRSFLPLLGILGTINKIIIIMLDKATLGSEIDTTGPVTFVSTPGR